MTKSGDLELHTLAGPYALDAVTQDERVNFVAHLVGCAQCQEDVREMREATARLGLAAGVRPRVELKEHTIRAAFMTSQLGPVVREGTEPSAGHRRSAPRLWQAARRARPVRMPARVALAAAALVAAAAIAFGLIANDTMQQLRHSQRQDHMIVAILNAQDAVMLTAHVTTGGRATVVMSHRERGLVFMAHGLRRLPSSQVYELWLMGPAGDRPGGMLRPAPDGTAGPAVVLGLGPSDIIGLTVEPASGSAQPSSVMVVVIRQHG
jgi:Anti-sigma-K factor rskA